MNRRTALTRFTTAALSASTFQWARCESFLSTDQARAVLFPGQALRSQDIELSRDQMKAIAKASGVRVRDSKVKAARANDGSWLIYDNVVGKHEFIDIAVAISASGAVKGVEILTYRESYGGEVRAAKWRAQFTGKTLSAPVKIDADIKNISGATLSSVHVTDGVRRLLHTHALVLKSL
jgi:Na+-translocating ferredoxin:NAD+ oxidoreductase RnfG subunit